MENDGNPMRFPEFSPPFSATLNTVKLMSHRQASANGSNVEKIDDIGRWHSFPQIVQSKYQGLTGVADQC